MPSSFSHGRIRPKLHAIVVDVAKRVPIVFHPLSPLARYEFPIREISENAVDVSTDGRTSAVHTRKDEQDMLKLDGSNSCTNNNSPVRLV